MYASCAMYNAAADNPACFLCREQALELLKRGWPPGDEPRYDPDHALMLCRMAGFKLGLIFLYENLRLFREVLQVRRGHLTQCIDVAQGGFTIRQVLARVNAEVEKGMAQISWHVPCRADVGLQCTRVQEKALESRPADCTFCMNVTFTAVAPRQGTNPLHRRPACLICIATPPCAGLCGQACHRLCLQAVLERLVMACRC